MKCCLRGVLSVISLFLIASGLPIVSAVAGPSSDGWTFNGVVVPDGRGLTSVKVRGDVTAGLPDGAPRGDWNRLGVLVCLVPQNAAPNANGCDSWGNAYFWPGETKYLDLRMNVSSPGTYILAAHLYRGGPCDSDPGDCEEPFVPLAGAAPVTIVLPASQSNVTRSSAPTAVTGDKVTFTAASEIHWSDGSVSDEPIRKTVSLQLQVRGLGEKEWTQIDSGSPSAVSLTESGEFRFLVDQSPTPALFVTVVKPTSRIQFVRMSVDSGRVFKEAPIRLTFALETLFDDSKWRPTSRQSVELQYSPSLSKGWKTVASGWVNNGDGFKNVRAVTSGFWRARSGSTVSEPSFVRVLSR